MVRTQRKRTITMPEQLHLFEHYEDDPITTALEAVIAATRLVRTTDPDTSHQAATNASKRGPSQRRRIWESLIALGEATDYELSVHANILRSSASKRRQELMDLGHVYDTGQRRKTDTGTMAIVWRPLQSSPYSGR